MPEPRRANPYVGPRPFERGEKLYGRDREIDELEDFLNTERVVLLHSPSGAGKSSLVLAGLLPRLEPFFDVWGPTRVNQEPPDGTVNRYLLSALAGFEREIPKHLRRPPEILAKQTLGKYVTQRPRRRGDRQKSVLLVFDQFEEVLAVDPLALGAREVFFDQLGETLRDPDVWALFVLREDYLASLDPYAQRVPTHLKNRFRIDLLSRRAAREAIVETAQDGGREFPAADLLVDDLRTMQVQQPDGSFVAEKGLHVEPVQLQVVCLRLWDAMPAGDPSIDARDLKRFGDVDQALGRYYRDSVERIAGGDVACERAIREWFDERLIAGDGVRSQVLREADSSGGLAHQEIESLLDTHLIRAEKRAGATWYELAHDRLLEPVRSDNSVWRAENLSVTQRRAALWERQKRLPGLLLVGDELLAGERWAKDNQALLTGVEQRFLIQSREEQEQAERFQRLYRRATSGRLAMNVLLNLDQRLDLASLLAVEATEIAGTFEARHALLSTVQYNPRLQTWLRTADSSTGVLSVAFNPDGTILASGSGDGTVRLWQVANRQPLGGPLTGDGGSVYSLAFSPSGEVLASGWNDGTMRLWDVASRRQLGKPLTGHRSGVSSVVFSPDGKLLASGGSDQTVRLWQVASRRPRGMPLTDLVQRQYLSAVQRDVAPGHDGTVRSVAFSPDGKILASGSSDGTIGLWHVASQQPVGELLTGHNGVVYSVAFSPEGILASGCNDGTVGLWRVKDRQLLGEVSHGDPVLTVAFSPDGTNLASGSRNGTARLWRVASRRQLGEPLTGHDKALLSIAFSPDGTLLASGSRDGKVGVWKVASRQPLGESLVGTSAPDNSVAFSPDGRILALGSEDGAVRLWDVASRQPLGEPLLGHLRAVYSVAFSPDGTILASGSEDDTLRFWTVASRQPLGEPLALHEDTVSSVAFSPDGRILASGSFDRTVRLWEVVSHQPLGELAGHPLAVYGVAFSPDGTILASGSSDRTARLWDVASRQPLGKALLGHGDTVLTVAFSPDGAVLVSGSYDRTVRLWDVATHQPLGEPLAGHSEAVYCAALNPNGTIVASGSFDGTVRLWEVTSRQPLGKPLDGDGSPVRSVSFSPDGTILASAGKSGAVWLWDVEPESWAARACRRANRNLSLAEWRQYLGPDVPYRRTCPDLPPGAGAPGG